MIENPTEEQLKSIKGVIYLITNKLTNQKYIGKTRNSFLKRYGKNWWKDRGINNYFKKSINKYKPENFNISLLETEICNDDLLYELEKQYIIEYNTQFPNGYNFSEGGKYTGIKTSFLHKVIKENSLSNKKYYLKWVKTGEIFKIESVKLFCQEHKNKYKQACINQVLRGAKIWVYEELCLPETTIEDIENYYKEIKIKLSNIRRGKRQSDQSNKKRSESMLRRNYSPSIETRKLLSEKAIKRGMSKECREGYKKYIKNKETKI